MKKIKILLLFMFLCACFFMNSVKAFADNEFTVKSKSAYQIDYATKTVIYEKNAREHLPIASMCKIMTQLLIYEKIDAGELNLNEKVTVSKNASGMGGSQVFLEENGEYSVDDLLKSISIASANDACVAMAERISGSTRVFVDEMNARAKELNMCDTLFENCTGLPSPMQYSCAKDVATMFSELISHKEYFKYSTIWTDEIKHPSGQITGLTNTNKLVRFYKGCDSGKTGYTSEAGHCLCASAKRDNMRLITVVVGAPDSKRRFFEVSTLFDRAFGSFCSKKVLSKDVPLEITANVEGGKKNKVSVRPKEDFSYFCLKNKKVDFDVDFSPNGKIFAPLNDGDYVGRLTVFIDGVAVGEVEAVANEKVAEKTYFDYLKEVIKA